MSKGARCGGPLLTGRGRRRVLDSTFEIFHYRRRRHSILGRVVERAANVEILTTSRERLNVQSEWVLDVHDEAGRVD
jgi:hypothetical protein